MLDLINFGSGFRNELHNSAGRGAYDTMTYGVLGLHLSKGWLTAKLMAEITLAEVAECKRLALHGNIHKLFVCFRFSVASNARA